MINYLNRPYSFFESRKFRLRLAFGASLFIFLFLVITRPFGLYHIQFKVLFLYSALYALVTLLVLLFLTFLVQPVLFKQFNIWKTFVWNICILFVIGVVNCIVVTTINNIKPDIKLLINFQLYTMTPGVLISAFAYLIYHVLILRKELTRKLNESFKTNNKLHVGQKSESSVIGLNGIHNDKLIYITSADNYIDVFYFEEGQVRHKLIRSTLDNAEQTFNDIENITRCHRSFIVNLCHVSGIRGNAAGYRLKLQGLIKEIPVSRKYVGNIPSIISQ